MSKISEQKALEAYPIRKEWVGNQYGGLEDINSLSREKYQEGYDQAFQDFMEKAERYLNYTLYSRVEIEVYGTLIPSITNKKEFINDFENYMKKEA